MADAPTAAQWRDWALEAGRALGLDLVGVAGIEPSARLALFPEWIAAGKGGEMAYLARRNASDGRYLRQHIQAAWPWARSVLCAGVVFNASLPRSTEVAGDRERGWISRYAWGEDYHRVLRGKLDAWITRLRAWASACGVDATFQSTVDTAPLVEREVAERAGLGWQGKNTCLIHTQKGSYFFLGTVITSLEMEAADAPLPDRCGSCTRCLDACPTQALEAYQMDARRCLAYLNIELRGAIPEPLRAPMGNNVLGCDICQDVCPWNRRAATTEEPAFQPRPGLFAPLLAELGAMTKADYRERFRHSAVKRAKFPNLQRNLALAMGNSGNPAFLPQLQQWEAGADELLAEHAAWARQRIHHLESEDEHA